MAQFQGPVRPSTDEEIFRRSGVSVRRGTIQSVYTGGRFRSRSGGRRIRSSAEAERQAQIERERQGLISEIERERQQSVPELRNLSVEQLRRRRSQLIVEKGKLKSEVESLKMSRGERDFSLEDKSFSELGVIAQREKFFVARKEARVQPSKIREPLFIRGETGKIQDINIGGGIRTGFRGFTGAIQTGIVEPAQGRRGVIGGLARTEMAQQRFDSGQIGVELFFTPGFSMGSSITKLAQPRTVFRQAPPKSTTVSRVVAQPTDKGALAIAESRTLTPARFETRASPLGERFGQFETVRISPRRVTTTVSKVGVEGDVFKGFAGRRTIGDRKVPIDVFNIAGRSQRFTLGQKLTPVEQRALTRGVGGKTKGLIVAPKDTQMFRGVVEAKKFFRTGTKGSSLATRGRRVTRLASISASKPVGDTGFFRTVSGVSDITKSVRGGGIQRVEGTLLFKKPPSKSNLLGGTGTVTKTSPKTSVVVQQAETLTSTLSKQAPRPRIAKPSIPKPPTRVVPRTITPQKTTQVTQPTQFTSQPSKVSPAVAVSTATTQRTVPKLRTIPRMRFRSFSAVTPIDTQTPKLTQPTKQIPKQTTPLVLRGRTISPRRGSPTTFPTPIVPTPLRPPKPTKPIRGFIPFLPSASLTTGKGLRDFGGTQRFANVPSFQALLFNIRGKERSRGISGLQFAPVPKGFSFATLFQRKKRKGGGKK